MSDSSLTCSICLEDFVGADDASGDLGSSDSDSDSDASNDDDDSDDDSDDSESA